MEAVEEEVGMARILGRRVDHLKEGCSPDSRSESTHLDGGSGEGVMRRWALHGYWAAGWTISRSESTFEWGVKSCLL